MDRAECQYSIYKINYEQVEDIFEIKSKKETSEYFEEVINVIIAGAEKIISDKRDADVQKVECNGFKGIFFKTIHDPSWADLAIFFIENNELKKNPKVTKSFVENSNISYILFYTVKRSVFVMTGGYGSHYISKLTEKNFGLYLIPKIFDKKSWVIKQKTQNSLTGNQASSQHANRNPTSFDIEQEMSSIFRQLGVETDYQIAKRLGVEFDDSESKDKKINILNKDSIVIRRSITLAQLVTILKRIETLEKSKDKFALNYIVLAKKKELKNRDLNDVLKETILNGKIDQFTLIGDDYYDYYTNAYTYKLSDSTTKECLIQKCSPITFNDVIEEVRKSKKGITITSIEKMLKKFEISTFNNAGEECLYPISIFNSIQGYIEYGEEKVPCFLFSGIWYVIDVKYEKQLKTEFETMIDDMAESAQKIKENFLPKISTTTEDEYNKKLLDDKEIIVAHTVLMNNIEIADAIFYDDDYLYFMHNKTKFDGAGTRDVTNQVLTASEFFQHKIMQADSKEFLKDYYNKIKNKYSAINKKLHIDEAEFCRVLSSDRKKVYVVGYIKSFSKSTTSNYAKYLSVELRKKLNARNYDVCILGLMKQ